MDHVLAKPRKVNPTTPTVSLTTNPVHPADSSGEKTKTQEWAVLVRLEVRTEQRNQDKEN